MDDSTKPSRHDFGSGAQGSFRDQTSDTPPDALGVKINLVHETDPTQVATLSDIGETRQSPHQSEMKSVDHQCASTDGLQSEAPGSPDARMAGNATPILSPTAMAMSSSSSSGGKVNDIGISGNAMDEMTLIDLRTPPPNGMSMEKTTCTLGVSVAAADEEEAPTSDRHSAVTTESSCCRICQEGSTPEPLISPCYCTGTVGKLHLSCLEHWVQVTNRSECELCSYKFPIERVPLPLHKFFSPSTNGAFKTFISDLICFFMITPLLMLVAYLCSRGLIYYHAHGQLGSQIGILTLVASLITVYITWLTLVCVYHYRVWCFWREHAAEMRMCREKLNGPRLQTPGDPSIASSSFNSEAAPSSHGGDSRKLLTMKTPKWAEPKPKFRVNNVLVASAKLKGTGGSVKAGRASLCQKGGGCLCRYSGECRVDFGLPLPMQSTHNNRLDLNVVNKSSI